MFAGRRRTIVAAAAALAGMLLASCAGGQGAPQPSGSASAPGQVVRFVTPYVVESLDPLKQGLWAPSWGYGELLMRATDEATVEPWLLERLDRDTPTRWRLVLRKNITFANGNALDASTLQAVFERHIADNPLVKESIPGIATSVVDATTLELTTSKPVANLPSMLADDQLILVFDPKVAQPSTPPESLVGKGIYTGAFDVTKLTADEMVLERNDDYWGGDVALTGARVRFVPDGQARVLAVRNGEADIALYPPTEALAPMSNATNGPRMSIAPQPLQQLRAFLNLHQGPMNDRNVRQAFAAGIDYEEIAAKVLDGVYSTPRGLFPDTVPYAQTTQTTDAQEAQRLLDEAGWRAGNDGIRRKGTTPLTITVLTYPQQPDTETIAVAMQAQLKPIGFDVKIREVPNNYDAMQVKTGWDVGLSFDGTLGYTYDPIAPLQVFLTSRGAYNFGGVADPNLDAVVEQLAAATDPQAQPPLLERAQTIIADNRYTVVVAQRAAPAVVGESFVSYRPSSVLLHLTARTRAG